MFDDTRGSSEKIHRPLRSALALHTSVTDLPVR